MQKAHRMHPTRSKLKKEKIITGAHVAEVRINHFVMDHIKELILNRLHLKQKKQKRCIYVDVKKPETHLFVTAVIINSLNETRCQFT